MKKKYTVLVMGRVPRDDEGGHIPPRTVLRKAQLLEHGVHAPVLVIPRYAERHAALG